MTPNRRLRTKQAPHRIVRVTSDWSFVEVFKVPEPSLSWDAALVLSKASASMDAPLRERLRVLLDHSNRVFEDLGGDPFVTDWIGFRPYGLRREEDWSDWLAWLLHTSSSGQLASALFNRDAITCRKPNVDREVSTGPFRHDLIVRWEDGEVHSVEVKIGDQDFAKTADAVAELRGVWPIGCDWILVPPEDLEACRVSSAQPIGWDSVARILRRCLAASDESLAWRVWAHAFVGSIEQKLLRLPSVPDAEAVDDAWPLLKHLEENHEG